ncbi:MAG: hypothetical protein RLZZ248_1152 [Bacteroidota bacterium]|jgi:2,3-bisphosphoglycerate-independent phosphoglycerate mutase
MSSGKVFLIILDGWGLGTDLQSDAIAQAHTPFVDDLLHHYPSGTLTTFGEEVGLPEGQMGNSEVGHLNIGAGRIVYQELARINKAIREKTLHNNEVLVNALKKAAQEKRNVHFMGLLSDGGVHSHINHLMALCDIAEENRVENIFIHGFLDGRDTDPKSGLEYVKTLLNHIEKSPAQLASLIGRYYAMDRDNRWERIQKAYNLLVKAEGIPTRDPLTSIQENYENGTTDEFMPAILVLNKNGETTSLADDDLLICFNFRTDRPREISEVLTQKSFPEWDMHPLKLHYLTMTKYDDNFQNVEVLFTKDNIVNTLGEVISKAQKTQVRIAETEKYPHVTFFFSGGREKAFDGERRILVPSPKVATYDLQPEMSALEIAGKITTDINQNSPDFICLNFANADMVGHTGDFNAAMHAAETVDKCMEQIVPHALKNEYEIIVIADHGNSDYMINADGTPNTAHTTNPVPFVFISKDKSPVKAKSGKLADIAPTILHRMGIPIPKEMDGENLIDSKP